MQDREKAANAFLSVGMEIVTNQIEMSWSTTSVRCSQFSRKTVPHPRSLEGEAAVAVVCSGAWNSQSAGVSGSKTPAGDC